MSADRRPPARPLSLSVAVVPPPCGDRHASHLPTRGVSCCSTGAGLIQNRTAVPSLPVLSPAVSPDPMGDIAGEQVLLHCDWPNRQLWFDELRAAGVPVAWAYDIRDWSAVQLAVGWNFTPELLAKLPSLRALASLGAGVDHALLRGGLVPPGVQVLRIVDPLMSQRMATWVLWAVINFQRRMDRYARAQAECRWDKSIENYAPWDNGRVRVGILGYGTMGRAAGALLRAAGYDVAGWVRTPRLGAAAGGAEGEGEEGTEGGEGGQEGGQEGGGGCNRSGGVEAAGGGGGGGEAGGGGVRLYCGGEQLREFVGRSDVLVCLLPLTQETRGILSAELLSWLPRGAALVNAARGAHLDEQALLGALDEGQLGGAVLDVFCTEPLPPSSPLWTHPRVRITPHVSAITHVKNAAAQISDNYRRLLAGLQLANVADHVAGY